MEISCWCLRQERTRLRVALAREHVHQAERAPFFFSSEQCESKHVQHSNSRQQLGNLQVGPPIINKSNAKSRSDRTKMRSLKIMPEAPTKSILSQPPQLYKYYAI